MVRPEENHSTSEDRDEEEVANSSINESHDPYYPPIVNLPLVEVKSGEDDEEVLLSLRGKLFRYDHSTNPKEWKERGTGDVRLLQHRETKKIRLLMRRDKTWKVCANHYIEPWMLLKPMSERAWIWLVHADYADEEPRMETFAIRFSNTEFAQNFKKGFEDAVGKVTVLEATKIKEDEEKKKSCKKSAEGDSQTGSVEDKMSSLALNNENKEKEN